MFFTNRVLFNLKIYQIFIVIMRRKDKEVKDKDIIKSALNRAVVCRLGLTENDMPYIVPMNFGYKDNCLYFHSAPIGKKIEIIKKNNQVCFEIDIDHELVITESACNATMKYLSIIGSGKAELIDDFERKQKALEIIMDHYTPKKIHDFSKKMIEKIVIIKVKIEEMTGKISGH